MHKSSKFFYYIDFGSKKSGMLLVKGWLDMNENDTQDRWENLTRDEKNHILYLKQKSLLETLLVRNAISRKQFDKSLHELTVKMGESF